MVKKAYPIKQYIVDDSKVRKYYDFLCELRLKADEDKDYYPLYAVLFKTVVSAVREKIGTNNMIGLATVKKEGDKNNGKVVAIEFDISSDGKNIHQVKNEEDGTPYVEFDDNIVIDA
jgi:hypothetical protein